MNIEMDEPKTFSDFFAERMKQKEAEFKSWCEANGMEYSEEPNDIRTKAKEAFEKEFAKQREESQRQYEAESQQKAKEAEEKRRIDSFLRIIPPIYRNATLEDFSERFRERIQPVLLGASALILGDNGIGKTHMAWAILKDRFIDHKSVEYTKAQLLLYDIKTKDNPYKYCTERFGGLDYLVIDEVDKIFESKADFVYLNFLIDHRYEWLKPTIIIGNGTKEQFIASLGQSIYSRLRGNKGLDITLTGKDKRFEDG